MSEPAAPSRASTCPLCGGPNGCALATAAAGVAGCWCATVIFDAGALARAAAGAPPARCLCRTCGEATARRRADERRTAAPGA